MNKKIEKLTILGIVISVVLSLVLLFGSLYVLIEEENGNQNIDDVPVLLGGEDEFGFPSTSYILNRQTNGEIYVCGGFAIERQIIVTAAHCVDDYDEVYVGFNSLNISSNSYVVANSVVIKDGWETEFSDELWGIENIKYDLAIIYLPENNLTYSLAEVETPTIGCGYKVVGYGRRLDEDQIDLSGNRGKESIDVCIDNSNSDLLLIEPEFNTGICFGDSGSPIYNSTTGNVVGVISSITNDDATNLCDINNQGLAVRLDSNAEFINNLTIETEVAQNPDLISNDDFNIDRNLLRNNNRFFENQVDENDIQGFLNSVPREVQTNRESEERSSLRNFNQNPRQINLENQISGETNDEIPTFVILIGFVSAGFILFLSLIFGLIFLTLGKSKK